MSLKDPQFSTRRSDWRERGERGRDSGEEEKGLKTATEPPASLTYFLAISSIPVAALLCPGELLVRVSSSSSLTAVPVMVRRRWMVPLVLPSRGRVRS